MIIALIATTTILTFLTWTLIKSPVWRTIWGILSLLAFVGSVYILTDHFINHTGLTVKSEVTRQPIYTAGETSLPYGILIYEPLGTKSDNKVLVYRSDKEAKKASTHFVPNMKKPIQAIKKTSNYTFSDVTKATLVTDTKRYAWHSKLDEILYGFAGEGGSLVSQKSTVELPEKIWLALTAKQAQQLAQIAKTQSQSAASPEEEEMAKSDPQAYAELQVAAIKKMLHLTN
ncbi:DUF4811 domain-containing protein [Streptococcus hyointestinalis]|nr:DUF4811 domain-containing protein [Streptococcus hyointestinalis]